MSKTTCPCCNKEMALTNMGDKEGYQLVCEFCGMSGPRALDTELAINLFEMLLKNRR